MINKLFFIYVLHLVFYLIDLFSFYIFIYIFFKNLFIDNFNTN